MRNDGRQDDRQLGSEGRGSGSTQQHGSNGSGSDARVRLPFQRLDVYVVARALAAAVHGAAIRDAELRDQATRAAKSVFLNVCEGLPGDRPAVRRRYFTQANGSLHEVVGAVDLAAAIGAVDVAAAEEIHALGYRVRGLLRGLLQATGGPAA